MNVLLLVLMAFFTIGMVTLCCHEILDAINSHPFDGDGRRIDDNRKVKKLKEGMVMLTKMLFLLRMELMVIVWMMMLLLFLLSMLFKLKS